MTKDDILEVKWAKDTPSFVTKHRLRGAKGAGLRYEYQAQPVLATICRESSRVIEYLASPWFVYRTKDSPNRWNYAQPDGLAIAPNDGCVYIVEIKLRHTADSYFQLLDRYLPMMETFFGPGWKFIPVEVCRWYDPHTAYPCKVSLREHWLESRPNEISVHRLRVDER